MQAVSRALRTLLPLCLVSFHALPAGAHDLTPGEGGSPDLSALPTGTSFGSKSLFRGGGIDPHRPDSHAPIGVMGDHVHRSGEWMVSLRWMRMTMDGLTQNGRDISPSDVFAQGFMVTPLSMDMDMLMIGGMYAPSDDWTLTAMLPYLSMSMDHRTGMGAEFTTESEGIGDLRLGGLQKLFETEGHRVHANYTISVPTGSIDEKDQTPASMGQDVKLPYPMQLGTGTVDLLPGLTYLGHDGDWSWGAQGTARFHLGENSEDYRHGNRLEATGWVARRLSDSYSGSLRLNFSTWSNFHGADPDLNPNMVPTADPDLRGGDRLDLLLGLNGYYSGGNRLALEFGVPIHQDLDGPQLETDWIATLGWQFSH